MTDSEGNNDNEKTTDVSATGDGDEPARTYEITATDHINKSMLETFRTHLENNTIKVPDNDAQDEGDWDD